MHLSTGLYQKDFSSPCRANCCDDFIIMTLCQWCDCDLKSIFEITVRKNTINQVTTMLATSKIIVRSISV